MKMIKLSALRTGRLYPPGNIPGTHFCLHSLLVPWSKTELRIPLLSLRVFVAYERVKPTHSFLLETESTPGPQYDPKDYINEKFQ